MAFGRTLQHRLFKPGPMHRTDPGRQIQWRPVVLILIAIAAAAFASYRLIVDPSDTSPPNTSYLPAASTG